MSHLRRSKHNRATPLLLLGAAILTSATRIRATTICPTCQNLQDLAAHLESRIPDRGSEFYRAPSQTVMEDWQSVVRDMMKGSCDNLKLPQSLANHYSVEAFIGGSYCILAAVDWTPWGAVIVNRDDSAKRLSIDVPHPLYDVNTLYEGITIFQNTNAKVYILSGSHRYANSEKSHCQSNFGIADSAHNKNTFLSSTAAILAHYNSLGVNHTVMQLHGMGESTCSGVDVHLSHGLKKLPPTERMVRLRNALARRSNWTVTLPGDGCNMRATLNIQGRLVNGVEVNSLCDMEATDSVGRFLHLEQKFHVRNEPEFHGYIIDAINEVFVSEKSFEGENRVPISFGRLVRKVVLAIALFAVLAVSVYMARLSRHRKIFQSLSEVELHDYSEIAYGSEAASLVIHEAA